MYELEEDLEALIYGCGTSDAISKQDFLMQLNLRYQKSGQAKERWDDFSSFIRYGRKKGWVEEQDILDADEPIEKRHAARILHMFLKTELLEKDEEEIGMAAKLADLYDCRSCVAHVAQMYLKGIMESEMVNLSEDKRVELFGMRDKLEQAVAFLCIDRVFEPQKRCGLIHPKEEWERGLKRGTRIQLDEVNDILEADYRAFLVDVRTRAEYDREHLEGAVHMPLSAIMQRPEHVYPDRSVSILLYCDQGIQSELAADRLADFGYENVYYFAWENH